MAYNLQMQIQLQAPKDPDIKAIKTSIESGLKNINIAAAVKSSLAGKTIKAPVSLAIARGSISEIKNSIRESFSKFKPYIKVDVTQPTLKELRKKIENALSNIKIDVDASVKATKGGAVTTTKTSKQPPLSPSEIKLESKKTDAAIKLASRKAETQAKIANKRLDAQNKIAEKRVTIEAKGKADASRSVGQAKAAEVPANERMKRKGKALKDYTYSRTIPATQAKKAQAYYDAKQTRAEGAADASRIKATAKAEETAANQIVDAKTKIMKANAAVTESAARTSATVTKSANQAAESQQRISATITKSANQTAESNAKIATQTTRQNSIITASNLKTNESNQRIAASANRQANQQIESDARVSVSSARAAAIAAESNQRIQNSIDKTKAQIAKLNAVNNKSTKSSDSFWDALQGKGKSFALYATASTAILSVTNAVSQATQDAIKYEQELINIAQTTGDSLEVTKDYSKTLVEISKNYNISLTKVAQFTRVLAQAGLTFREAAKGAEVLARTTLLSGFDSVTSTTEGLIAVMETFNITVTRAGQVLESVNALSKAYAVESGDLVEAIKRAGGAFSSAGGQVEELLALFTAVRSTTRESAETIATGFRTIFSRLQRPKTIEFFKKFNIELATLEGNFIGPYQAIEAISTGLEKLGIRAGSIEFARIAEEIGGIRQLSKVIPLLEQTAKKEEALAKANNAGMESIKDLEKARQGLGYQLGTLQKEFSALISEVVDSSSFKFLADVFINISKSVLGVTSALKPLLPLLAPILAIGAGKVAGNLLGGKGKKGGIAGLLGFASGGYVPGSGSGDTIPAMLTPGEFVVKKSSAQAFGYENLEKVNKYAKGGIVGNIQYFKSGGVVNQAKEDYEQLQRDKRRQKLSQDDLDTIEESKKKAQAKKQSATKAVSNKTPLTAGIDPDTLKILTDAAKSAGISLRKFTESIVSESGDLMNGLAVVLGDLEKAKKETQGIIGQRLDPSQSKIGSPTDSATSQGEKIIGAARIIQIRANAEQAKKVAATQDKADRKRIQAINTAIKNDEKAQAAAKKASKQAENASKTNLGDQITGTDDLVQKLNSTDKNTGLSIGAGLDQNVLKNFVIKLEAMNRAIDSAEQDLAKKAKETVASKSMHPFGISPTPEAVAAEAEARNKLDRLRQTKSDATASAITKAGAGGLSTDLGLSISEAIDQIDRLDKSIQTATNNVKNAIDEENKAIEAERKAKAKALKDWMDSPLLTSAGGSRADRLKEAQEMVRQSDTPEVAAAKKARGEASQKRYKAQMEEKALQDKGSAFTGFSAAAKGYTAPTPPTPPVIPPTLYKQATDALSSFTKTLMSSGIHYVEAAIYAQSLASGLKAFGANINQEALTQGTVKGGLLASAGEVASSKYTNKFIYSVGKSMQTLPGPIGKFGSAIAGSGRQAVMIGRGLKALGKGLDIAAKLELLGGLFDSIFSTDYAKQKDQFIELGNVAGAGSAAINEYAQSQLRAIPIIGGFLSGLQGLGRSIGFQSTITEKSLDANGQLFVSNAKLAAGVKELQTSIKDAKTKFSEALTIPDSAKRKEGVQKAFASQFDAIDKLQGLAQENASKNQTLSSDSLFGINIGQTLAVAGAGALAGGAIGRTAGMAIGGGIGAVGGAAAGGVGAIPGAAAGAASGGGIGQTIGAITGAIAAGTYDLYKQATTSKELIIKSFGFQQDAVKESSAAMIGAISSFGDLLSQEVVRVVRGGGSMEDAVKNVTDKLGEGNINRLFSNLNVNGGNRQFGKDIQGDIQALGAGSDALRDRIFALKGEGATLIGIKKAENELAVERLQSQKDQIDEAKKQFITVQALGEQERKLRNERDVQSRAIAKEIKLRKSFQEGMDKVNQTVRDLGNIEQEIANIGTGKLTSRQAASKAGISVDPRVLEMSTEEILRNKDALSQMADSVDKFSAAQGIGGGAGQVIRDVQSNFEKLAQLTSDPEALKESMIGIQKEDETAANELKKNLLKQVGVAEGINPILEAAVLDYAEAILKNGTSGAAEAEQAAREKVSKLAAEFIEQNKEKLKELAGAEQKYRELQIEQVSRRMDLAKQVYESEKSYFEERLALTNKVADALSIEPTGKARSGFIGNKARVQKESQMAALGDRRSQSFGEIGLGGMSAREGVSQIQTDFRGLSGVLKSGADAGAEALVTLKAQAEALANTIRDEIDIEQQYLDGLIESAKAQQEYTQALYDAQGAIIRDLVTGTDEDVGNQLRSLNAASVAASQGSFAGIPESLKKDVFSIFDQFRDIEIPGLGKTGKEAQREITKNEMMRKFGVDAATAEQLASKAVEDRVPIDQKMAEQIKTQEEKIRMLFDQEKAARDVLINMERLNNELFGQKVQEFGNHIDKLKQDLGQNLTTQQAKEMNDKTDAIANAPEQAAADERLKAANKEEQQKLDRMAQLEAEATQPPASYGLNNSQKFMADQIMEKENQIGELSSRGGLTPEETAKLEDLKKRKSQQEHDLHGTEGSYYIPFISDSGGTASKKDVELYKEGKRRQQSAAQAFEQEKESARAQTNAEQLPDMLIPDANRQIAASPIMSGNNQPAASQPVQVEAQGQQEVTVRLPDIQALVNQGITGMIYETVAQTFTNLAQEARTANNFNDLANAMANAVPQTNTVDMGGQV